MYFISGRNIRGDSNVCYRCSLKALRQLAYHYRKHIDPVDLPGKPALSLKNILVKTDMLVGFPLSMR